MGRPDFSFLFKSCEILEVRGDLSINVENKNSLRVHLPAYKNYALALVLCAFNKSQSIWKRIKSIFLDIKVMLLHYFLPTWRSTRKLFLFSTLIDKSPLTSNISHTFEKKREVRSPLPIQPNFLVFCKFHLF